MGRNSKAGKVKSATKGLTYKDGKADGVADTLELVSAFLMTVKGFSPQEVKEFLNTICDWRKYANEPELNFYISTVRKINAECGFYIRR